MNKHHYICMLMFFLLFKNLKNNTVMYNIDTVEYQYSIKIKYCDILTYRYFLTPLVFKCCVSQ